MEWLASSPLSTHTPHTHTHTHTPTKWVYKFLQARALCFVFTHNETLPAIGSSFFLNQCSRPVFGLTLGPIFIENVIKVGNFLKESAPALSTTFVFTGYIRIKKMCSPLPELMTCTRTTWVDVFLITPSHWRLLRVYLNNKISILSAVCKTKHWLNHLKHCC